MRSFPTRTSFRRLGGAATPIAATLAAGLAGDGGEPDPAPEPEPTVVDLAKVDGWERVAEASEDVFGAERPEDLECDEVMGMSLEDPGDAVKIRIWHCELVAPEEAEAHLALAIDGEVAWESSVPIPSEGGIVEGEIEIDREIPAGAELQFHVHNHGINAYDLLGLEATVATPP